MSREREDPRGISKDGFSFHEILRHIHSFRIFVGFFFKKSILGWI